MLCFDRCRFGILGFAVSCGGGDEEAWSGDLKSWGKCFNWWVELFEYFRT